MPPPPPLEAPPPAGEVQHPPPPPAEASSDADIGSSDSSAGERVPQSVWVQEQGPPASAAAPAAAGKASSRTINEPFRTRGDVGSFAVYQGNWGGRRSLELLRDHIFSDIVLRCPANILCAQEVDKEFIQLLKNPSTSLKKSPKWVPKSEAAAVAAKREEIQNASAWHVVHGDEGGSNLGTCIVAVRASVAREIQLVEWRRIADGQYKNAKKQWRPAESRILVARIIWRRPMHGEAATVVATAHMHRMTAKKARGFDAARADFWGHLNAVLCKHRPVLLTGDFNMALAEVVPKLRAANIPAELLSWFAWVQTDDATLLTVAEAEEEQDDGATASASAGPAPAAAAPASAGPAPAAKPNGPVLLDSCGIITLRHQKSMKACLNVDDLKGTEKLPRFSAGQGYPLTSYIGGEAAAIQSLTRVHPLKPASEVPEHDPLTHTKSKLLNATMWDATQLLFRKGAHMPLIAYFGNVSGRSEAALSRREEGMIQRGWGPTPGGNRSQMMQKQGKGPAPSVLAREARASAAAEAAQRGYQ